VQESKTSVGVTNIDFRIRVAARFYGLVVTQKFGAEQRMLETVAGYRTAII
jgi:hypothetical protein